MKIITIDARMVRSSGIGVVLANILPVITQLRPDWQYRLLGEPAELDALGLAGKIEIVPFHAPIYTISEQTGWPAAAVRGSDLVLSPNYNIPLRWPGPLLTIVHDVAHLALHDIFGGRLKQAYARWMFTAVRRRSRRIVFVSHFSASEFRRLVGEPRSFEVIHDGVDISWFDIMPPVSPARPPYFLYIGNVKPHKNLGRLMQAFAIIKDRIPHRLMIVGRRDGFITPDGSLEHFETLLADRLHFTGPVPKPELQLAMGGAAALVFPSLYEGFGLPPLEAMAAGCPALVSRAASLPEICGEAALYCDPHNPDDIAERMMEIAGDAALRSRLRAAGKMRAATFDWQTAGTRYVTAIERSLEEA